MSNTGIQETLRSFEAMDACHQQMVVQLRRMSDVLTRLEDQGADGPTREMAGEILRFFHQTAREHHRDEEKHVFPALVATGRADLVELALRLQQDHGWIEEDWLELAPHFEAIAGGYNWYNLDVLKHAVPIFQALYLDHMALEDAHAYPESKTRLMQTEGYGSGREGAQRKRRGDLTSTAGAQTRT